MDNRQCPHQSSTTSISKEKWDFEAEQLVGNEQLQFYTYLIVM